MVGAEKGVGPREKGQEMYWRQEESEGRKLDSRGSGRNWRKVSTVA